MKSTLIQIFLLIFALPFISQARIIIWTEEAGRTTFNLEKIDKEATWSPNLSLKADGLITNRKNWMSFQNFWVQTQPIAIGSSWKPLRFTGLLSVVINGKTGHIKNSKTALYFRYSCDRNNWSTWYRLDKQEKPSVEGHDIYTGGMRLPLVASEKFDELKKDWLKTNPVWQEDEHEFSVWLVKKQPDFFAKEFPFIGYIQVRLESYEAENLDIEEIIIERTEIRSGLGRRDMQEKPEGKRKDANEKWFFDNKKVAGK